MYKSLKGKSLLAIVSSVVLLSGCGQKSKYDQMVKLIQEKKYDQAIEACDKEIKANPKDPAFYAYKGEALGKQFKCKEAKAVFEKAIELKPTFSWFYDDYGAALAYLGEHEKAIEQFDKSIKMDSSSKEASYAYGFRAFSKYCIGQEDDAIKDATAALKIEPENIYALDSRAKSYNAIDQFDKAIDDASLAISINKDSIFAYVNRATSYINKGEFDKALLDAKKAISLKKENWFAMEVLAGCYFAQKDYTSAESLIRKCIAVRPEVMRGHMDLFRIQICSGEVQKAKSEARVVINENPGKLLSFVMDALIASIDGDAESANSNFSSARSKFPRFKDFIDSQDCLAQLRLGNYDRAIYLCGEFLEIHPKSKRTYRLRSEAYRRQGNDELAKLDYDKAVSHGYKKSSNMEDYLKVF